MVIRESSSPFLELDVSGSVEELRSIAEALVNVIRGQPFRVNGNADAIAAPYQRCLTYLEVCATEGQVRVSVVGDSVHVTGSPEMLQTFASFFEFDNDAQSGFHHHHEYYPGNQWIAPDSRPLVICVA